MANDQLFERPQHQFRGITVERDQADRPAPVVASGSHQRDRYQGTWRVRRRHGPRPRPASRNGRRSRTAGLTGRVDLLLTTLRPTSPRSSLGDAFDRLHTRLTEYRSLLRPGGHVVVTSAPYRHPVRHELIDVSSQIAAIGSAVGLAPVARCLALTADVHSRRVRTHAAFAERRAATRVERALGHPIAQSAHHTALVFGADPDVVSGMGTRQGGNGPRSR